MYSLKTLQQTKNTSTLNTNHSATATLTPLRADPLLSLCSAASPSSRIKDNGLIWNNANLCSATIAELLLLYLLLLNGTVDYPYSLLRQGQLNQVNTFVRELTITRHNTFICLPSLTVTFFSLVTGILLSVFDCMFL